MVTKSVSSYPITEDAKILNKLMGRVLETTEAIYENNGVPLPARRYWSIGQTVEDCEQVTVVLASVSLGLPGAPVGEPVPCSSTKYATIRIQVTRNFVNSEGKGNVPPRGNRIQEFSELPAIDAWLIMDNLKEYDKSALGISGGGVLATATAAEPNGSMVTTTVTLTIGVL